MRTLHHPPSAPPEPLHGDHGICTPPWRCRWTATMFGKRGDGKSSGRPLFIFFAPPPPPVPKPRPQPCSLQPNTAVYLLLDPKQEHLARVHFNQTFTYVTEWLRTTRPASMVGPLLTNGKGGSPLVSSPRSAAAAASAADQSVYGSSATSAAAAAAAAVANPDVDGGGGLATPTKRGPATPTGTGTGTGTSSPASASLRSRVLRLVG